MFEGRDLGREFEIVLQVVVELDVVERVSCPEGIIIKFRILEFFLNGSEVPLRSAYFHVIVKPFNSLIVRNRHMIQLGQIP